MAPRRKTRGRDPLMEPGLETATRGARKPAPSAKKPTSSARPRSAEAKAARRATSRGASEAQAAAGRGRSRSAEATAARRSVARRTAAGSEAAQAAMGTGRNRAAEARAATRTPRVLIRPKNEPYDILGGPAPGVPRRRTPTPFTAYDELGNQIPARRRRSFTPRDVLAGPQDQASINRAFAAEREAEMRRKGQWYRA